MGSSDSTSKQSHNSDILSDYKEIKRQQGGIVLMHNHTEQTFLLKEFTFASQVQFQRQIRRYQKQIEEGAQQNVLSVKKIKSHTISGICSTSYKLYVIYEYPQVTLQDQISARQKEQKRFDEHELWSIIQSCNNALALLKPISLNAELVYITPDGLLKVIHNDMIDENYRYTLNSKYYYAPEKIRNFTKLDNDQAVAKEAIFSMGMTILQAALLDSYVQCYDFDQKLFLEPHLDYLLESLNNVYSNDLVDILSLLLKTNPNDRPSNQEIQNLLDNYWNHQGEDQTEQESETKNGESLNIQGEVQKRFFLTSHSERGGIFKNLATINSQQKESVLRDDDIKSKPINYQVKIAQSIEQNQQKFVNKGKKQMSSKQKPKIQILQQTIKPTIQPSDKENLYTDPKLLQMIKRDLEDISRLKQSTLKETIKYSFLYPQTQSIFSSVRDAKLISNKVDQKDNYRLQHSLKDKNENLILKSIQTESKRVNQINFQKKIEPFNNVKQFQTQRRYENQPFLKKNLEKIEYLQYEDEQGRIYQGQTLNGKKHGWGKMLFADGAYYEGEFKNDEINGRGILYYCQKKPAYDGMWMDGKFHGKGILYNQNPLELTQAFDFEDFDEVQNYWVKYEGDFFEDFKQGLGRLYLSNGEIIEGHFESDFINGQCKFINNMGEELHGVWRDNKLTQIYNQ